MRRPRQNARHRIPDGSRKTFRDFCQAICRTPPPGGGSDRNDVLDFSMDREKGQPEVWSVPPRQTGCRLFCQDRSYTNILYLAVSLFSSELHLPCPQKDVLRPSVKKLRCPHAGIKNRKNIAISLDFSSLGDILSGKRNGFGRSGEMADALDSKSGASNGMRVRVPPSAPFIFKDLQNSRSFFLPFLPAFRCLFR